MKSSRDQLKRLRQVEAELDSRAAESDKLRKEIAEAMRVGQQLRWPPEPQSSDNDSHSSS